MNTLPECFGIVNKSQLILRYLPSLSQITDLIGLLYRDLAQTGSWDGLLFSPHLGADVSYL